MIVFPDSTGRVVMSLPSSTGLPDALKAQGVEAASPPPLPAPVSGKRPVMYADLGAKTIEWRQEDRALTDAERIEALESRMTSVEGSR